MDIKIENVKGSLVVQGDATVIVEQVTMKKPVKRKICSCGRCSAATTREEYKIEVDRLARAVIDGAKAKDAVGASDWARCENKVSLARVVAYGKDTPFQAKLLKGIETGHLVPYSEVKYVSFCGILKDVKARRLEIERAKIQPNTAPPKRRRTHRSLLSQ